MLKYFYLWVISLWVILTLHILYLYTEASSEKKPIKGGTFVEVWTENINFLPYINDDKKNKIYQSFLFDGCLEPFVDWTKISYRENLCSVNTNNYKKFTISVKSWKKWSNWKPLTIDDVYFTYKKILKENIWKINSLEKYSDLKITKKDDILTVEFPFASIDNMIFFSNFILPYQELKNSTPWDYINQFSQKPLTTNCGKLKKDINDPNSIVFDLSECENTYLKYYQYKTFENFENIKKYINDGNKNIVDFYINEEKIKWYNEEKIILNKFIWLFFNTNSKLINRDFRRSFTNFFKQNFYNKTSKKFIIKDQFLFNSKIRWNNLKKLLEEKEKELLEPQIIKKDLPELEWNIELIKNTEKEFFLPKIEDRKNLEFSFLTWVDRISITHNKNREYFLTKYQKWEKNANYNIAKYFNNVTEWKNTYKIKWYQSWNIKWESSILLYIWKKPEKKIIPQEDKLSLDIIYHENSTNNYTIKKLKELFKKNWIQRFFNFKAYQSYDEFEGKLSSKNFHITLRGIDMGLKKDISNIFKTQNPLINPSFYINNELALLVNQYFLSSESWKKGIKQEIDKIYSQQVPFFLIWKKYWKIFLNRSIQYSFPERIYDYQFLKDRIKEINLKKWLKINKDKLFNIQNFINYIKTNLKENH